MKNLKFKITHWCIQKAMDLIGGIRLKLRHMSKYEVRLAGYHVRLLNKQMALRAKYGIKEIECHVEWSAW